MLKRFRRGRRPAIDRRIEILEERVASLERLAEGLQDAVYRDSVRHDERTARLEKKVQPNEIARALSEDARRRGL